MKKIWFLGALVSAVILPGCATEQVYAGTYEILQTRQEMARPPQAEPRRRPMTYEQYEAERKELNR
jgi:hypothetical protein